MRCSQILTVAIQFLNHPIPFFLLLSDCPKDIDLRAITDKNVHCHVLDYCTGIRCCMLVPLINWNFEVFLLIDTCNLYLDVSIERLSYTFPIYSYNRSKFSLC